jgi:spore coat polysaccharide biosynthesis predicted glycosyltransferase SpsG
MMPLANLRVLYRVAAGPRTGFGHLVRSRSLARAIGDHPLVSIRGSEATRRTAASSGWTVINMDGEQALDAVCPDVLVVDDPSAAAAEPWIRAARRASVPVAAIHDLGLGYIESDLGIDGSVLPRHDMTGVHGDLTGPAFAILDPAFALPRSTAAQPARVLVALGGGAHVGGYADGFADAIARAVEDADIRVASGFTVSPTPLAMPRGRWIRANEGLAEELASADVVVCAGGLTLYEACALGRPAVAVSVTGAQQLTITAVTRRGAAINAGAAATAADRVGEAVAHLMAQPSARHSMADAGRRLVDGRGAFRVADALRGLVAASRGTRKGSSHAA